MIWRVAILLAVLCNSACTTGVADQLRENIIEDRCVSIHEGQVYSLTGIYLASSGPGQEAAIIPYCDELYPDFTPQEGIALYGKISVSITGVSMKLEEGNTYYCDTKPGSTMRNEQGDFHVALEKCGLVIAIDSIDRLPVSSEDPDALRLKINFNPVEE